MSTALCGEGMCEHDRCRATWQAYRHTVSALAEGFCPVGHGRLHPAIPGACLPCCGVWTVGGNGDVTVDRLETV